MEDMMINSEEDAKLSAAVATFGDNSWQIVASHLDGRTSNQCSVRWRNTLLPDRKRVGRWSVEEDKRLKVAVILFGAKNWKKLAQFIEGRTQSQCRERWTEEEDAKLLAAIEEHGHSWSKVAACVPRRTDNQCRRRWKVLLPHEVPILRAAHQLKRTVLISNFVGRKCERPAIGPNDFIPLKSLPAHDDTENNLQIGKKRSREQSNQEDRRNASSKSADAMESGYCKRARKRSLRVCRPKTQRRPIDELLTSGELSEDALMELPLVEIMKLLRKNARTIDCELKNHKEDEKETYETIFCS
ncbi:hypothetical protein HPP92_001863 [Vanilla planifolia]|uniref:Uncharacterized protein n=1 Tax=Vanilla planifolia TaxID=51239 RepID=A0A835S473_VANPL|nr:hypothetical protein HPP92_001863 [Vanilla planifolia]